MRAITFILVLLVFGAAALVGSGLVTLPKPVSDYTVIAMWVLIGAMVFSLFEDFFRLFKPKKKPPEAGH